MSEHKLHSISKSFISQVIMPQVMFFQPIYFPRALNTGTCRRQGDLFYSAGLHRNQCQPQSTQEKSGEVLEKMQVNRPKGKNKQERHPWQQAQQVWLYTDLLQALKGEHLNSVFSPDGTLISASAARHCSGKKKAGEEEKRTTVKTEEGGWSNK